VDSFDISNKDDLISKNLSFEISKFYDKLSIKDKVGDLTFTGSNIISCPAGVGSGIFGNKPNNV